MRISAFCGLFLAVVSLGWVGDLCAEVRLVRFQDGYRPAEDFVRISEYFDAKENTRGATVLRTQPTERSGYYFLLRTKSSAAVTNARLELSYITPTSPVPVAASFVYTLPAGSHVTQVGLTGADWPDREARPVAWQVRLLAADGSELLTRASFLWAKPPGAGASAPAAAPAATPAASSNTSPAASAAAATPSIPTAAP